MSKKIVRKIPVGILGATGMVGQRFAERLAAHPWFEIALLTASNQSVGKKYGEAVSWRMPSPLPSALSALTLYSCGPQASCQLLFSALDPAVAEEVEQSHAQAGAIVISNASPHRLHPGIPLLVPEVNGEHLALLHAQRCSPGKIITNPNCSVIGLAMALKPLADRWGIEQVQVTTLQAISGAGYPGVPSLDILDNVIPFIKGEEEKLERELPKIFGSLEGEIGLKPHPMRISAQCNRVAVTEGHMACVSVKLSSQTTSEEIIGAWENFTAEPQTLDLPSAPKIPVLYLSHEQHPQPRLHRDLEKGMAVLIGRLRPCPLLDWKFILLSHNTIRGAAGGAILSAELMLDKGYL